MTDKKVEKSEEAPKKVAAKLFSDVRRPEDTPAQATSKPVIVGHTNIIQDPMMSTSEKTDQEATKTEVIETLAEKPKHELKLQPLSAQEPETVPGETPAEVTETEIAQEEPVGETEEPTQEANVSNDEDPQGTSAAVDAIVDTINTKKERDDDTEKQQVIDNEVNDLIDSKQYNVKIRPAPNRRKIRLLLALLALIVLVVVGWYFGLGPGKDLWLEKNTDASIISPSTVVQANNLVPKADTTPQLLAFTNSTIKTTFSYPKAWKVDVSKDPQHPTVDVITLTSPAEEIDSITKNTSAVKTETNLRARIFVENTKNTKEYASDLTKLTTCSSEDIIVGSSNLKLLFLDTSNQGASISKVSVSPSVCSPSGSLFNADDQVQLSTKQNTYVIYAEYIFSNAYLEKNGTKTAEAIKLAQESGITTSKESFKSAKVYAEFIEIIKSLKEL